MFKNDTGNNLEILLSLIIYHQAIPRFVFPLSHKRKLPLRLGTRLKNLLLKKIAKLINYSIIESLVRLEDLDIIVKSLIK